jgi:hypothetical protein
MLFYVIARRAFFPKKQSPISMHFIRFIGDCSPALRFLNFEMLSISWQFMANRAGASVATRFRSGSQ